MRALASLAVVVVALTVGAWPSPAHLAKSPAVKQAAVPAALAPASVSRATQECLDCHEDATPGIVGDWRRSLHARVTLTQALAKPERQRRVSLTAAPPDLAGVVVGCAECHTLDPDLHKDTWDHEGTATHVVVTPRDCAHCHPVESEQFAKNVMSAAHDNLANNAVYRDLMQQVVGVHSVGKRGLDVQPASDHGLAESCYACHGTKVERVGTEERVTASGTMTMPVLSGWPNQGVGRINPDGSRGACSACHARHEFSIAMARKPETCGQCHSGPDTPVFDIYRVSKHGNIYAAMGSTWTFDAVPWKVGEHFTAPTCATCHIAEITDASGAVLAPRTHMMGDRLPWRLFGAPFAHPHPKGADTSTLKNADGLPLATAFDGTPAAEGLVDDKELATRLAAMQAVCRACHTSGVIDGHFARLRTVMRETNAETLAATQLMQEAWRRGLARGQQKGDSLFNEPLERRWANSWLLYANSVRLAAAMAGADYGSFDGGRWQGSENLLEMQRFLAEHGR